MELVVWYGFKLKLCKSESSQTIHCFIQILFKCKFGFFSLQMFNIPLQKSLRKTRITCFYIIWLTVDFWSNVDFLVKWLTKVNWPYYTSFVSCSSFYTMVKCCSTPHHESDLQKHTRRHTQWVTIPTCQKIVKRRKKHFFQTCNRLHRFR